MGRPHRGRYLRLSVVARGRLAARIPYPIGDEQFDEVDAVGEIRLRGAGDVRGVVRRDRGDRAAAAAGGLHRTAGHDEARPYDAAGIDPRTEPQIKAIKVAQSRAVVTPPRRSSWSRPTAFAAA